MSEKKYDLVYGKVPRRLRAAERANHCGGLRFQAGVPAWWRWGCGGRDGRIALYGDPGTARPEAAAGEGVGGTVRDRSRGEAVGKL